MTQVKVSCNINATRVHVFKALADIRRLPEIVPEVQKIDFLSDKTSGIGTRFRETRVVKGNEATTELEITEFAENSHIRMVADSHGTVWDSLFTKSSSGEGARLEITMEARAHALLPKLLNPVMKGLYKKGIQRHLDAFKSYCES